MGISLSLRVSIWGVLSTMSESIHINTFKPAKKFSSTAILVIENMGKVQ
jgi:hypothetical protein